MTLICYLFLFLAACSNGPSNSKEGPRSTWSAPGYKFSYKLSEPDATFKLDGKLDEISGLSLYPDGKHLVAVQDEDGLIFLIDKNSGKISEQFEFWKDGDYEGVEVVGADIFVLKSSGTLYQVTNLGKKDQKTEKYNTFLNEHNDVEGLAYDAPRNRLLLACKAKAGDGKEFKMTKGIYAFNLSTMSADTVPVYLISQEQVHDYLKTDPAIRKLEEVQEFFQPNESEFGFSPSGLAIHPLTGDLYLTSSVGKMLMVLNPAGQILHIEKLKKKVHAQPEGICFEPDGTLYISNEGKHGSAQLHRFLPK